MSTSDVLTICLIICGLIAAAVGWLAYRDTHRAKLDTDDASKIKAIVDTALVEALEPVKVEQADSKTRTAVLETQVDLLWKNLQKDMARLLHSPDPRRAHIDYLMEKLIDEIPLTPAEENELRDILKQIISYEPGVSPDLGFPVHPGEQMQAAFLLRSLDYVPIRSRRVAH